MNCDLEGGIEVWFTVYQLPPPERARKKKMADNGKSWRLGVVVNPCFYEC